MMTQEITPQRYNASKNDVIASQRARWRGNPPDFRAFSF